MNIEEYAKKHKHLLLDQIPEELDMIIRYNNFGKIIDVGCGGGLFLYSLYKREYNSKFKEIWGVDLSEERLKGINDISPEIKVVQDDAQILENVPDNYFDIVVSTQVIEHVPDDGHMLEALYKISKSEALIYIDTVFKKSWAWYFYKNDKGKRTLDPTHVREYQHEDELFKKIDTGKFRILFSKNKLVKYSLINFIIKALKLKSKDVYNNPIVKLLSFIQIPVPGYYIWKILLQKK
ncbi:MAG TPA: methyltransferase domain-containing protein [Clostridiales bacterium]|nr:methyltransferase domain-containing protein [Clostridiales bacterium]